MQAGRIESTKTTAAENPRRPISGGYNPPLMPESTESGRLFKRFFPESVFLSPDTANW
jgi:hypothetical protein